MRSVFLRSDDPLVALADVAAPVLRPSFVTKVSCRVAFKELPYPRRHIEPPPQSNKVAQGRYRVAALDCYGCHFGANALTDLGDHVRAQRHGSARPRSASDHLPMPVASSGVRLAEQKRALAAVNLRNEPREAPRNAAKTAAAQRWHRDSCVRMSSRQVRSIGSRRNPRAISLIER
jgi:hypothetical protein